MDINNYVPTYAGLSGKNIISAGYLKPEEIYEILYTARLLKLKARAGERQTSLLGKQIMMISKTSQAGLRISFEVAIRKLCGGTINLSLGGKQLEEFVSDADGLSVLRNFGVDGIVVSTEENGDAGIIKECSSVPVINGNDLKSPCLSFAYLLTIWEKFGKLKDLTVAVIGDMSKDICTVQSAVKCGMNVHAISPTDKCVSDEIIDSCAIYGTIKNFDSLKKGIEGCDAVIICRGDGLPFEYCLTEQAVNAASEKAVILSSFPLKRGEEIEERLAESERFIKEAVAENLLMTEQSILSLVFGSRIDK